MAALLLTGVTASTSRRIWLVVPLVIIWGNLHGAALVGVAAAGAYLLLDRIGGTHRLQSASGQSWSVVYGSPQPASGPTSTTSVFSAMRPRDVERVYGRRWTSGPRSGG